MRDLYIFVQWANAPFGTHTQELRFVLPESRNGTLYQSFLNPFGSPHGRKKVVTLVDDVPIAGTFIESRSLTGAWRVDVYLDGIFYASPIDDEEWRTPNGGQSGMGIMAVSRELC